MIDIFGNWKIYGEQYPAQSELMEKIEKDAINELYINKDVITIENKKLSEHLDGTMEVNLSNMMIIESLGYSTLYKVNTYTNNENLILDLNIRYSKILANITLIHVIAVVENAVGCIFKPTINITFDSLEDRMAIEKDLTKLLFVYIYDKKISSFAINIK